MNKSFSSLDVYGGAGYLLLTGPGGTYSVTPAGVRRVTTGRLLAVGRSRWLTLDCDYHYRCTMVVIDRSTSNRDSSVTIWSAHPSTKLAATAASPSADIPA